jgi:tetratricopeptide (TPR) repeat protein
MDSNNPVVKLCVEGMQAEAEGRLEDALGLFLQAWAARQDDFDACIAAHYVARHQKKPEDTLHWNHLALEHAEAAGDERVQGFYPSLYLNMGWSYEKLGDPEEAGKYYELAAARLEDLPAGPYRDTVQEGINNGRKRVS